jgi:hypothetical protein
VLTENPPQQLDVVELRCNKRSGARLHVGVPVNTVDVDLVKTTNVEFVCLAFGQGR